MNRVGVFIVDDSALFRSQIKAALSDLTGIEVLGAASNGRLALAQPQFQKADIVILDLEMPELDGLQTLSEIKSKGLKCKVIMFSSASKRGAEITLEALQLGAFDYITKPDGSGSEAPHLKVRALLLPKIEAISGLGITKIVLKSAPPATQSLDWSRVDPKVVVIGSSTGGPTVIETIFKNIRGPFTCPILIVQHMPPVFTATFAERLSRLTGHHVTEAIDGEAIESNHVYIAPGNYHMRIGGTISKPRIVLDQGEYIQSVRPAADPLFETAAQLFGDRCLGIVLTGMGRDGLDGARKVKARSGAMMIQERESCVVFGMPGAIFESGNYDRMGTPLEIAALIQEKTTGSLK